MLQEKLVARAAADLAAPQAKAFEILTQQMGRWWPTSFSINGSPIKAVVLEPTAGGRWYEEGEDGSQVEWGKVVAFEAPGRVVLNWKVGASYSFDPDLDTELELTIVPTGSGASRLELAHRDLENYGEAAATMQETMTSGWAHVVDSFKGDCAAHA
jgi:hypothetical protein